VDRGNWQFRAERPNQLWVSDFTSVSIWQGWLYVASVVDVYARRIVGWRVSKSMTTAFVLDALEQALYARQPGNDGSLTHHSDRASQYVSIRYSECLAEAGIEPSVGRRRGDNYDNALAESISGLCKAELIPRRAGSLALPTRRLRPAAWSAPRRRRFGNPPFLGSSPICGAVGNRRRTRCGHLSSEFQPHADPAVRQHLHAVGAAGIRTNRLPCCCAFQSWIDEVFKRAGGNS